MRRDAPQGARNAVAYCQGFKCSAETRFKKSASVLEDLCAARDIRGHTIALDPGMWLPPHRRDCPLCLKILVYLAAMIDERRSQRSHSGALRHCARRAHAAARGSIERSSRSSGAPFLGDCGRAGLRSRMSVIGSNGPRQTTRGAQCMLLISCISLLPDFQRVCRWTDQSPHYTRGSIVKLDCTAHAHLRHGLDDGGAEPAAFRRPHGRAVALRPVYRENVTFRPPADVDAAGIGRERAVFAGIGRKLMNCKTDGLSSSCVQTNFPAMHCDP
jgi:hypothetical protein